MRTNLLRFLFIFVVFIFAPYLNAKEINIYSHRQPFLINPFLELFTQESGIKIKINTVALKGINDQEIPSIIKWAHSNGMDITLIETMPMGDIDGNRTENYLPLTDYVGKTPS